MQSKCLIINQLGKGFQFIGLPIPDYSALICTYQIRDRFIGHSRIW